ncbi:3228_t:CDS:2, partial [Acaulospora colombiana]
PWALSPLISTMPYFAIHRDEQAHKKIKVEETPAFASSHGSYLHDNVSELENVPSFKTPSARRQYFASNSHRKEVDFKTSDIIASDFCYGFLSFPDIRLNLPGGISFDLLNYWDGQPVRFVCCERRKGADDYGRPLKGPGDPFWVVVFEAVPDDEIEAAKAEQRNGAASEKVSVEDQRHLREDID